MRAVEEILHEWKNRMTYFPNTNQPQMVVNTSELELIMGKVASLEEEVKNANKRYWDHSTLMYDNRVKYCNEIEEVQKKLTDAINTNTEMQAEIRNLRAKVQYWEDKYCLEYHTTKWPGSEVMELRASNEFNKAVARAFGKELVELKEKLLELGGCPNA